MIATQAIPAEAAWLILDLSMLALALMVLCFGLTAAARSADRRRREAEEAEGRAERARERAESVLRIARDHGAATVGALQGRVAELEAAAGPRGKAADWLCEHRADFEELHEILAEIGNDGEVS